MRKKRLRFERLEDRRLLATFTVINNLDAPAPSGDETFSGTLRQMVVNANETIGADRIVFNLPAGQDTIDLAEGQLLITDTFTILGPGRDELTIDAGLGNDMIGGNGDGFRVFDIALAATSSEVVKISGLTITGGDVTGDGGGIRSSSSLELQSMAILDNHASGDGGGIHVNIAVPGQRQFTMTDVIVDVHS